MDKKFKAMIRGIPAEREVRCLVSDVGNKDLLPYTSQFEVDIHHSYRHNHF
jgi:hypothetical protein